MKDTFFSEKLDGKKIIFIGNSMIYYGRCVERNTNLEQEKREDDRGYFKQICASHGVDVSVTNWTFGGHQFRDLLSDECEYCDKKGNGRPNHKSYLTDRNYDYVVLSEGSRSQGNFVYEMKQLMKMFTDVNPNTKFVYLCHLRQHMKNLTDVLYELKTIADMGVTICDWGKALFDILNDGCVEGGSEKYNNNTFIISQSENDGHHGNLLSGYLTALATYSAITGKKCEGQSYDFYNNTTLLADFDVAAYKAKYYCYGDTETNFDKIFTMPQEMLALQRKMDYTLSKEEWKNYGEDK